MTGQDIVQQVWTELSTADGLKKIAARRKMIEQLRDMRQTWLGPGRRLRIHKPGVLTIDQSRMKNAGKGFTAKVLVSGNHVADVELDPRKPNPRFVLLEDSVQVDDVHERTLEWKNDDQSSRKIGAILRACSALRPGSSELQIQLELVKRLDASKSENPELAALRPVKPFGLPTEIATSVSSDGKVATGNMDILARTGGGRDGGDFVVLELKRPALKARYVPDAFRQAIRYAAALTIEANALAGPACERAAVPYRQFFSDEPRSDAAKYERKPLVAHAVVVLPAGLGAPADEALSSLGLDRPLVVAEGHPAIRVGVLLFEAKETAGGGWRLATGPDAFRWSKHPNAWRPRQRKSPRRG